MQIASEPLEREVHGVRAPMPLRPAIEHVLEEMAEAVRALGFVPRADLDVERHVRPVDVRLGHREDTQVVGEGPRFVSPY